MRKEELVKYIEGELTPDRERAVEAWLQADNRNMEYYAWLKALYVSQEMPVERAESAEETAWLRALISPSGDARCGLWKKMAFAGAVAAMLIIGIFNIWHLVSTLVSDGERVELAYIPEGYKHTIYTEKGVKARVVLPDSTKVLLNCDSKIVFPDKFSGPTREVFVSGEAFFEVTSDSLCPMVVTTPKNFRVEAMGTTFCISAYEDDPSARTTLINGRVDLISAGIKGAESETIMRPNDSYVILSNNRVVLDPDDEAANRAIGWTNGALIFDRTPMKEVISRLRRWYGVKFIIEDEDVLSWRITATFHSESIMRIMDMLEYTTFIDYSMDENVITLRKKRN